MKKFLWSVFGMGALLFGSQAVCLAQQTDSDSQRFTIRVPKRVSIVAPVADQLRPVTVLDLAASELTAEDVVAFDSQAWAVKGNVKNGVTVDFVAAPFAHSVDPISQNVRLTVAPIAATTLGPATWSLTSGSATSDSDYTDLITPNALVSYSSDRVGQTDFSVDVGFVAADLYLVQEGDYVTDVIGTVTEN